MSDLISRQAVLEVLESVFNRYRMAWNPEKQEDYGGFASAVPNAIKSIPTAYDVDKVVEQLEENAYEHYSREYGMCTAVDLESTIEIVQKGGAK